MSISIVHDRNSAASRNDVSAVDDEGLTNPVFTRAAEN